MKIFHYHPETMEFIDVGTANPSPANPEKYLIPAFATELAPPELKANEAAVFNEEEWKVKADYRSTVFYDKNTKEEVKIEELGEEPTNNLTADKPREYEVWDENKDEWVLDLEIAQQEAIDKMKYAANHIIRDRYPYYKQVNINELQGYTEQNKTEMWTFINSIREQSKKLAEEINTLNDLEAILSFEIDIKA